MSFDPDYASVSLLLHGDGANGSTTFTDSSATPKTVTAYGNAQISTAQSKFGGASMAFDGVNSYARVPADVSFAFDAATWTLEGWFLESSIAFFRTIFGQMATDDPGNCSLSVLSYEGKLRVGLYSGTSFAAVQCPTAHTLNAWHHFAVVCASGVVKIYLDGVFKASNLAPGPLNSSAQGLSLGASLNSFGDVDNDYGYWHGGLDDIRLTPGAARYTVNFTPPSEAFADSSGDAAPAAYAAAPSPLSAPAVLAAALVGAYAAAPSSLAAPAVLTLMPAPVFAARTATPSPLGAPCARVLHDFTGLLGDVITRYAMDLLTPTGPVRVPISSWQATLQTSGSNYVQCVIPACSAWADLINTATAFVIYRTASPPGLPAIEYEMTRAPAEQVQFDRGPSRYTCTLSGYTEGFAANDDPASTFDRTLTGVRSISSGTGGQRVRCAVDWLLRPGQRAIVRGDSFVVSYINYYSPSGFDSYMDVGSRT